MSYRPLPDPDAPDRRASEVYPQLADTPAWRHVAEADRDFSLYDLKYEDELGVIDPGWAPTAPARIGWTISAPAYTLPARMLWRDHGASPSRFVYDLPEPTEQAPVKVALFGDFGTGGPPARWIAAQMTAWAPTVAIHLGDVYYAGTEDELEQNLWGVLQDLHRTCEVWTLVGDHERFSLGGGPFVRYIDDLREGRRPGARTRQEGTYFCLRSREFQLIGLDGNSVAYNRLVEDDDTPLVGAPLRQRRWLNGRLQEAAGNRTNLLLSQSPPHDKDGDPVLFGRQVGEVLEAARNVVPSAHVDAWFWGDTHHAAVYARRADRPFLSVAAGHAAIPEKIPKRPDVPAAAIPFWEDHPRFPRSWKPAVPSAGVGEDRARARLRERIRNGWYKLELRVGGVVYVELVDWLGHTRHRFEIRRSG